MSRPASAFTLLEIMLAVAIGAIIMVLAVPSISGLMEEQRAQRSFDAFDELVQTAQSRAVASRKPVRLLLTRDGIELNGGESEVVADSAEAPAEEAGEPATTSIAIAKGEEYSFQFPAALVPQPAAVWTFWPTGTCEPAVISYAGPEAKWSATYDALTARADLTTDAP